TPASLRAAPRGWHGATITGATSGTPTPALPRERGRGRDARGAAGWPVPGRLVPGSLVRRPVPPHPSPPRERGRGARWAGPGGAVRAGGVCGDGGWRVLRHAYGDAASVTGRRLPAPPPRQRGEAGRGAGPERLAPAVTPAAGSPAARTPPGRPAARRRRAGPAPAAGGRGRRRARRRARPAGAAAGRGADSPPASACAAARPGRPR